MPDAVTLGAGPLAGVVTQAGTFINLLTTDFGRAGLLIPLPIFALWLCRRFMRSAFH